VTLQDLGNLGEFVAAIATLVTLVYLAQQIRASNRLARAEASRAPNSDLNTINATFATHPPFRPIARQMLNGARRVDFEPDDRTLLDYHLVSITNLQEQLLREIRAGVLPPDATDFGGAGLFRLPYYRDSWSLYRPYMSTTFVEDFERLYDLDPTLEAEL